MNQGGIYSIGTRKRDCQFSADDGTKLVGQFFYPEQSTPAPTVIMAHGFSAQKEHHLVPLAVFLAGQGLNVLLYDHRNWGGSGGDPRFESDPVAQIRDYRCAITYAEGLPEVDRDRIGIWGTSYSGGHVLVVGAIDRRVKAVVSQVPFVNGYENFLRRTRPEAIPLVLEKFNQDRRKRAQGMAPEMMPVVSSDYRKKAVIPGERAYAFFTSLENYPNRITLRSLEMAKDYVPLDFVARISPTPLLIIASLADTITPSDLQLSAYERALEPKRLVTLKGDHFAAYMEEFETAATGAAFFFREHLGLN